MNRTIAKRLIEKYIPMLSAYANGSNIEYKDTLGKWKCVDFFNFQDYAETHELRIKPEPRLRPWKEEEVPVGAIIRGVTSGSTASTILSTSKGKLYFTDGRGEITWNFLDAGMMGSEYSTDFGKTWQSCGILTHETI